MALAHGKKNVDSEIYLRGRERPVQEGEIMGRSHGDADKLFPRYTHASAATTGEINVNGKPLKLWTFTQLESLKSTALRQRVLAIKDLLGGDCPALPSGQPADMTRWIIHMQEQLTNQQAQESRFGGYGAGNVNVVPTSFARETEERPISPKAAASPDANEVARSAEEGQERRAMKMRHLRESCDQEQEEGRGIVSGRYGGEGRKHLSPRQHIVQNNVVDGQEAPGGRRYIPCRDNMFHQQAELEAMQQPGWKPFNEQQRSLRRAAPDAETHAAAGRQSGGYPKAQGAQASQSPAAGMAACGYGSETGPGGAGSPQRAVWESHLWGGNEVGPENVEMPLGGERRKRPDPNCRKDHFINPGVAAGGEENARSGIKVDYNRGQVNQFRERQNTYRSTWKQNPSHLLGSSMLI
eukprot:TRINITY_DN11380_c0_g1_i1.p1 TRINITY_DN11380_c0_g1~~TRINITY_DN11380_c0_g1_i1.p1  ORF type:complete len:410 (+),score=90.24 TRINITY_DN11380_c0_g1_i1:218-1447(+)